MSVCREPFEPHFTGVRSIVMGLLVFLNPRRIFRLHLHDSIEHSQAAGGNSTLSNIYNRLFYKKNILDEWKGPE
jgi:hypothetical protein